MGTHLYSLKSNLQIPTIMSSIFTPINQIKLTNVSIVRLKRCGKRFEIACYKNKVLSWRDKSEKDINEVLQSDDIFSNVGKGEFSKKSDINKAFGHLIDKVPDREKNITICKFILEKGQLQVNESERKAVLSTTFTEIANIIAQMVVNLNTNRAIPAQVIERAMKEELHYSIKPHKSSKSQALEIIKLLIEKVPTLNIGRANMRLQINVGDSKILKSILNEVGNLIQTTEKLDYASGSTLILVQPGDFKAIDDFVSKS